MFEEMKISGVRKRTDQNIRKKRNKKIIQKEKKKKNIKKNTELKFEEKIDKFNVSNKSAIQTPKPGYDDNNGTSTNSLGNDA